MTNAISCGPIHHLRLTVTNLDRSRAFYTQVLGFGVAVDAPPPAEHAEHDRVTDALQGGIVLINGTMLLGLRPAAPSGDRFDENRVGLDHLSFAAGTRADLDRALTILDEWSIPHGQIRDLGPGFGLYILEFRDPDNIQLELTAPYSA